jgi:hypothetical protein
MKSMRTVTFLWWCLLLTANIARAQVSMDYLVLDVAGHVIMNRGEVSIGGTVAGSSTLSLDAGQQVTLLGTGVILLLKGPATVTPAAIERTLPPRPPSQIAWMARLGEYLRTVLRPIETRAPILESAGDFHRLRLTSGAKCVIGTEQPRIFIPSALRDRSLILLNLSTGMDALVRLDAAVAEWPLVLRISDGDRYEVMISGRTLVWTLHVLERQNLNETELIDWMMKNNCSDQVLTYVRSLPFAFSWSESR